MKRLYTYSPVTDGDDFFWSVEETETRQIIETFLFEEDATEYMHFLENGGGFAGWTPSFMLTKIIAEDINESFAVAFGQDVADAASK
jgi:hypothetical protein